MFKTTDMPPILIVMRGYGGSWGFQRSSSPREGLFPEDRIELTRGDEIGAAYEVTAEPFTESFMLAGKEQGLDAGRVLLADFASEPVRVRQLDIGDRELAEARDALADARRLTGRTCNASCGHRCGNWPTTMKPFASLWATPWHFHRHPDDTILSANEPIVRGTVQTRDLTSATGCRPVDSGVTIAVPSNPQFHCPLRGQ